MSQRIATGVVLTIVVALAAYLRLQGLATLGFGWDDIGHILWRSSPSRALLEIIRDSYQDAHPPLRNVLLHGLAQISMAPLCLRAVAYLPGILFVGLVCLWLSDISGNIVAGAIGGLIAAFSIEFIALSRGTRPYMLLACFLVGYLWSWHRYIEEPRRKWLYPHILCGALAAFSHYGAAVIAAPVFVVSASTLVWAHRYQSVRVAWLALLHSMPMLVLISQFLLVKSQSKDLVEMLSSTSRFQAPKDSVFYYASCLREAFDSLLIDSRFFQDYLIVLAVAGILLFAVRKRYAYLSLCILSVLQALALNCLGVYPLVATRHLVPILIVGLIPVCFASAYVVGLATKKHYWTAALYVIGLVVCFAGSPVFSYSINKIMTKDRSVWQFTDLTSEDILEVVRRNHRPDDQLVLSARSYDFLLINGFDMSELYRRFPAPCVVPAHFAFAMIHPTEYTYGGDASADLRAYLSGSCGQHTARTRYWCLFCKSVLGMNELQTIRVGNESIMLFADIEAGG